MNRREQPTPRGRFIAAEGSTDVYGFSGDDAEVVLTSVHHLVRVVDQRHRLWIRVDVRRRNVRVRSDIVGELRDEPASDRLQIFIAESLRIAHHTTLGSTERDIDHRTLPRHPGRERPDLVRRNVGVITDATFSRPADAAMDGPIADEVPNSSGRRFDREFDSSELVRPLQVLEHAGLESGQISSRVVALKLSDDKWIEFFRHLGISGTSGPSETSGTGIVAVVMDATLREGEIRGIPLSGQTYPCRLYRLWGNPLHGL